MDQPNQQDRWYAPVDGNPQRFAGPDGFPALHLIDYRDTAGEQVLRLCEDATGLLVGPGDRRLPPVGVYVSQLRGEAHHQQACRAGDFAPGAEVKLVPEPHNPYDRWAVAVYDATGQHHCAYVNKQKARMLGKVFATGAKLSAISLRGTPAGRRCEQIAILAAAPAFVRRLLEPRPAHLPSPVYLTNG